MKKKKKLWAYGAAAALAAAALLGGVGTLIGMNVRLMKEMRAQEEQGKKVIQFVDDERERQAKEAEQENVYQEDGYKVMDKYEIRSTKQISDAYLKNDPSGLGAEDRETYDMAKKLMGQIIKDQMSCYEKELAIYDWMVENISTGSGHVITLPGQNTECFTPHDVFINKNAVCVGYATTFRLLANMAGLDVHIVHNDYHSWDLVQLDDGEWYHVDVYSDSGSIKYRNFNMTDDAAKSGHDWDGSSLPEAKGTKYSYAVQNAKPLKSMNSLPEKIRQAIDKRQRCLFFKFPEAPGEEELALADQTINLIRQAVVMLPEGANLDISGTWVPNGVDDNYILAIYINDYSNNVSSLPPEQMSELVKRINETFGTMVPDPNDMGTAGMEEMPVTEDSSAGINAMADGTDVFTSYWE